MSNKIFFPILFVLVMTCPVMGQVKKQLTEADYRQWSTMELKQLSEKGNWVSYSLQYESGIDTLFVKHTKSLKTYDFAGGTEGTFATDDFFVVRDKNGDVILANLKSGKQERYSDVMNYTIAMDGQLVVLLKNAGDIPGNLLIVSIDGTKRITMPTVSSYSLNPARDKLVYDSKRKLQLMDLNRLVTYAVIDPTEQSYQSYAWQSNGDSFAYIVDDSISTVGYYRLKENKRYTFDRSTFRNFPAAAEIYNASGTELSISDDGSRVFFGVLGEKPLVDSTGVQVWNTADKVVYPRRAALQDYAIATLGVWFPEEQKFRMLTNSQLPNLILIPGQEYALVCNPFDNEPQFDYDAPMDYYLQDIATGEQRLFLPKFSADHNKIDLSRAGNYIAYFKEKQWWLYDIKLATHKNLTGQTGQSFIDEKYDRSGEEKVCGIAGWTTNDKEVLVYDQYDLWLLKTDGSSAVRLTNGREAKVVYRIVSKSPYGSTGSVANGILNLNEGLHLEAVSDTKTGYFTWNDKKGLQQIVFENSRVYGLKYSPNGVCIYIREHYHVPPQILVKFSNRSAKLLYQSNPQQRNYQWGFSKLITYENSKGTLLNGALFYPAGYTPDKNYPMVVYIYERLSDYYNQYVNPSLFNQDGFNISNLTTQGYFVLLPDIAYDEGKPGRSALDCVISAVNEVAAHESVDKKRVGLVGHSFGGFETSFIVTQTDLFAAAISGAGFNDFVSSYLSVGRNNKKQDSWRYEYSQVRMGVPLYEAFQQYLQNSPITFAPQMQTPFLIWAGIEDSAINYTQSLEFHLALRRLGKPNILLLYEKEGHAITKPEQQIDLSRRMMQWWDYHLKEGSKPDWFRPNSF